jgi:hypothetical protein
MFFRSCYATFIELNHESAFMLEILLALGVPDANLLSVTELLTIVNYGSHDYAIA